MAVVIFTGATGLIGLGFVVISVGFVHHFGEYAFASPLLSAVVVLPIAVSLLFFWSLRLSHVIRFNLTAIMMLAVFVLYAFEGALQVGWYVPPTNAHRGEPRPGADKRSLIKVVEDLRREGKEAYPAVFPRGLFTYSANQTLSALGDLLPIGGISNVETVVCNENGEFLIYRSDERGFNNPMGFWDGALVEILAVGDSFTQGHCVDNEHNFIAKIRERFPRTLNLGMSGNGPLAALGGLREYLVARKPKVVLWFYFEENDISEDLPIEERSTILAGYLDGDQTQRLIDRQPEIDARIRRWLESVEGKAPRPINAPPPLGQVGHFNLLDLLFLRTLRNNQNILLGPTRRHVALFKRIMVEARAAASAVGARFYVVNLPSKRRFMNLAGRLSQDLRRDRVFALLTELAIPVIDIIPAFEAHLDPTTLYYGHYTEAGNALVARVTMRALARDWPE